MKTTVILATTEERIDGVKFSIEGLLSLAATINKSNERGAPKLLTFFDPWPYEVRAWVGHPIPGGPAVLYAEGYLRREVVKAATEDHPGQHVFVCSLLPYIEG